MDEKKNYIKLERHKWPDEIEAEKNHTKKRFIIVICCAIFFALGFGVAYFGGSLSKNENSSAQIESDKLNQIYDVMKNEWYFGKDIDNLDAWLIDNAINGMLANEKDSHTQYFDVKEGNAFMKDLEGNFVGIGVNYITLLEDIVITRVFSGSPAQKAGLEAGDIVTKVNGISSEGKTADELVDILLGEEGSKVLVEVRRGTQIIEKEITREQISITANHYVKDQVGIIEIDSFKEKTHLEVEEALTSFAAQDIKKIIIDLRDNGGGLVSSAIEIASYFMDSDKVVIYEENKQGEESVYKTKGRSTYDYDSLAVLVNGNTASASEALAACLKDNVHATVVGTKTYGKGTVQVPVPFSDGSIFKYTVAEWLTPNKEKINKKGITPDVKVHNDSIFESNVKEDDATYQVDSVGTGVKNMQVYLRHLGYDMDRVDGYYSQTTLAAVKKYQQDKGLEVNGVINTDLFMYAYVDVAKEILLQKDVYDLQMLKALEVVNGN